jgi:predicted nucleotidyltransferase
MVNDDIIAIKDTILDTVGETCEKIILFGSYAYGTPREKSDYDIFVVLKDDSEKPILTLQKIYRSLSRRPMLTPVDLLANYKSRFEWRSTQPTIERRIANNGVVLYERQ